MGILKKKCVCGGRGIVVCGHCMIYEDKLHVRIIRAVKFGAKISQFVDFPTSVA